MRSVHLADFSGHAFTLQLAQELERRQYRVVYTYCEHNESTPHADFDGIEFVYPVDLGHDFQKYRFRTRLRDELAVGLKLARRNRSERADVLLATNMPVLSLLVLWLLRPRGQRRILWLQDIQGDLVVQKIHRRVLRLPARLFAKLEGWVFRRADYIIAIAEPLAQRAREMGVEDEKLSVIENWAVLDQLPELPVNARLRAKLGVESNFVFMYSGTLGIKHRPELLHQLAEAGRGRCDLVVVSQGPGADWLRDRPLPNLHVIGYRPFGELAQTLAAADVLVVLLEDLAETLSVPSKVLSYLCAGRTIIGAVPNANPVSDLIESRAECGFATADPAEFVERALDLLEVNPSRYAERGRAYAELNFGIELAADRFETVLS